MENLSVNTYESNINLVTEIDLQEIMNDPDFDDYIFDEMITNNDIELYDGCSPFWLNHEIVSRTMQQRLRDGE